MPSEPIAHVEVERKFTADQSAVLPALAGGAVAEVREVAAVALDATYHDTADLRLLGAGITLRRREGGDDEGWQVKVAAGSGRLELQRPLTKRPTPPVAVRRLLRGVVRAAELVPVAEVRTERSRLHMLADNGRVLAEMARDQVRAVRLLDGPSEGEPDGRAEQRWHEIELELVDGDMELLEHITGLLAERGIVESQSPSKLRQAVGDMAPPLPEPATTESSAGNAVLAYMGEQWATLLRQDVAIRAKRPEGVHKARTASRRLRSALAAYRRLFDADRSRQVEDRLRQLARALSGARDLQVIDALTHDLLDQDDAPVGSVPARRVMRQVLDAQRREAGADVDQLLTSEDYLLLLDEVAAFVARPALGERAAGPAPDELRQQVRRTHRRVVRRWAAAEAAEPDERDEARHAARKATKRLRYACEIAEPVLGSRARRLRRRAKKLANLLGERQDAVVLQQTVVDLLPRVAVGASAGDVAFALGRLHARLDVRVRELDGRVAKAARRVQTRKAASWLD